MTDVTELKECLCCGSKDLKLTLDLKKQPLANSYKKKIDEVQPEFPLAINRCTNCFHVQLTHAVNPDLLFKDYLYVSGTSNEMKRYFDWFATYTREYYAMMWAMEADAVLDIGCNDGTQLDSFKRQGLKTFGVDPAENLHALSSVNHTVWPTYFSEDFVHSLPEGTVKPEIIIAQNVFAHNSNPLGFLNAVKTIMMDDSLLFIQTSQADMILHNEFDTIYHEHISFFNVNSMLSLCLRAGINLIDVIKTPLHGNSYVFVISKNQNVRRPANIGNIIDMEKKAGLYSEETYVKYRENCEKIIEGFHREVEFAKHSNFHVIGYGAAAKGMTLLNASKTSLNCIIDDNPMKQRRFTPGMSIPIVSIAELDRYSSKQRIFFVPLAWNFFNEISARIRKQRHNQNDKFLKYFPDIEVIGGQE